MKPLSPKRILVINVNWVGDVLFSTPFLKALHTAFPESHISCMVPARCAEILEANPRVHELIVCTEPRGFAGCLDNLFCVTLLRKRRFDTVFLLHRSWMKALLPFLAGSERRIGYDTKGRRWLLTDPIESSFEDVHKVEYFLNLLAPFGIDISDKNYEFFVKDPDRAAVERLLEREGVPVRDERIVALNPGGNWGPKRWPLAHWIRLARWLVDQRVSVVVTGAEKDLPLARSIAAVDPRHITVLAGKTTLKQLGALFLHADLVISADSGPMHLAVALKRPVLALFGPTSPALTGPYGDGPYRVLRAEHGCDVPCYDFSCIRHRCMEELTPEMVFEQVREVMSFREPEEL